MLKKPCRKLVFLDIRQQESYSKSKPKVVICWMVKRKLNAGQLFPCFQTVPSAQLESWYCLRKPQWPCSTHIKDLMPSVGASSCVSGTSIIPEAARPKWIKVAQKSSASCANTQAMAHYRDVACLAAWLCPGTQQAEVVGFWCEAAPPALSFQVGCGYRCKFN